METYFQKELEELKQNLLRMATLVEEAIHNAVQSLVKRDIADHATNIAEDVIFMVDALVIKHHANTKEEVR